jgi:hypothetical protein
MGLCRSGYPAFPHSLPGLSTAASPGKRLESRRREGTFPSGRRAGIRLSPCAHGRVIIPTRPQAAKPPVGGMRVIPAILSS